MLRTILGFGNRGSSATFRAARLMAPASEFQKPAGYNRKAGGHHPIRREHEQPVVNELVEVVIHDSLGSADSSGDVSGCVAAYARTARSRQ
ncbi:hypothetical protein GCM10010341_64560 [Streptomyces noursei]|nr:hypothetical protein GCM10010341_64560 [Streptomyces noursei]